MSATKFPFLAPLFQKLLTRRTMRVLIGMIITFIIVQWCFLYAAFSIFWEEDLAEIQAPERMNSCLYINYETSHKTFSGNHTSTPHSLLPTSGTRLTSDYFYKNFVTKNRPVVIRGSMKSWPALHKWTNEYLKSKVGNMSVQIAVSNRSDHFGLMSTTVKRAMPFNEFVDKMEQHSNEILYLNLQKMLYTDEGGKVTEQGLDIPETFLQGDFELPPFMLYHKIKERNFWMGPGEMVSRLHHDASENVLCMVFGYKRFIVFPPSQTQYLYPYEQGQKHFSKVDIDKPDFVEFPLMANAKGTGMKHINSEV